jgi:hypothetical protein
MDLTSAGVKFVPSISVIEDGHEKKKYIYICAASECR